MKDKRRHGEIVSTRLDGGIIAAGHERFSFRWSDCAFATNAVGHGVGVSFVADRNRAIQVRIKND